MKGVAEVAVGILVSVIAIVFAYVYYSNSLFLATECWQSTAEELDHLSAGIPLIGAVNYDNPFHVILRSSCLKKLVFGDYKKCLQACDEGEGDKEECMDECEYCKKSESCVIALPKKSAWYEYVTNTKEAVQTRNFQKPLVYPLNAVVNIHYTLSSPKKGERSICIYFECVEGTESGGKKVNVCAIITKDVGKAECKESLFKR